MGTNHNRFRNLSAINPDEMNTKNKFFQVSPSVAEHRLQMFCRNQIPDNGFYAPNVAPGSHFIPFHAFEIVENSLARFALLCVWGSRCCYGDEDSREPNSTECSTEAEFVEQFSQ